MSLARFLNCKYTLSSIKTIIISTAAICTLQYLHWPSMYFFPTCSPLPLRLQFVWDHYYLNMLYYYLYITWSSMPWWIVRYSLSSFPAYLICIYLYDFYSFFFTYFTSVVNQYCFVLLKCSYGALASYFYSPTFANQHVTILQLRDERWYNL